MAVHLLAMLIALGLLHLRPRLMRRQDNPWFRAWVHVFDDASGALRSWLTLLLPAIACLIVNWMLGHSPLGKFGQLLFDLLVLLYVLGIHSFEADLEAILNATDDTERESASRRLTESGEPVEWRAHPLGRAIALAALRRRFGVVCWFFLLGPAGALLYRCAQQLGRDRSYELDENAGNTARWIANGLDWLPAQLLVFTLALVGHWEAVIGVWQRWWQNAVSTSWYRQEPTYLGEAACADIAEEIADDPGSEIDVTAPSLELKRMRNTLLRALLAWLSVAGLLVLGGYLG